MVIVHGAVAPGFEDVRDEFAAVLAAKPDEAGAQLAVFRQGKQVVDLWAGDGITGDSLHPVFSSTKGAAHLVVALLVQDGVLDLDRPVGDHWPEFPAEISLRGLLSHRAGLIGVDGGFTQMELADDRIIAKRLAGQRPFWTPGTAYGYHAFVIGALTGEVVRRATGQSIQEIYETRLRVPYGLDFYLGLPPELDSRFVRARPTQPLSDDVVIDPLSLTGIAFNLNALSPTNLAGFGNSPTVRRLGPASAGGVGNARGLAGMYAAALELLTPPTIAEFSRLHTPGTDLVTDDKNKFALGFEAVALLYPSLGPDAFGHSGAAGSQALADPRTGIAYGYAQRQIPDPAGAALENERLIPAVLRCAGLGQ
ncbi:serine hydrolase [Acrocarpospora corrugata]|uniref:Serine hydrolase n=1 Tax=Acrocarpospora corrugata TaxID=35763 RepID=A0A5M3VYA4_9ACTN|nr:serine hydrolase domain-containing protein [Acrocarpospora corrugata]GER99367.1 serine hydrolase [Acrocarpospora corrugata]